MPFNMVLWAVQENDLAEIPKAHLADETRLEDWIEADGSILGLDILIIGRQVKTGFGGRIDLLGIDRQGDAVILELKRDKSPRDVVAQVLDYAAWVVNLTARDIDAIAGAYLKNGLADAFRSQFNASLPESINMDHSMIIVASELDEASERIVQYLATNHGVNVNAIFFSFFKHNEKELVGRAWLMDPQDVAERRHSRTRPPWSGYYFVNVGEGERRNWDDCREYGFISAGGDRKYSKPLERLEKGDKLFAYMKGLGYVGFGEVASEAVIARKFVSVESGTPLLELDLKEPGMRADSENTDRSEYVVGVHWLETYPRDDAKWFTGAFANQNIVCKLRHQETLDFLKREFGVSAE